MSAGVKWITHFYEGGWVSRITMIIPTTTTPNTLIQIQVDFDERFGAYLFESF
ncbi:hypothetical protein AAC03nite_38920 [Alicyclobacillus acidoterrestris]|nr:hypothetical protein AAC03nite_38920 [Alicyclobacillus acidoterrestris]